MKIENINCKYLKVYSESLESAYNDNNVSGINMTIKVNNGTEYTDSVVISSLTDAWTAVFDYTSATTITQLKMRNIFTDQAFNLLADGSSFNIDTAGIAALKAAVEDTLVNTLGIAGVTQEVTTINNQLTYIITGLPDNLIMDKIYYAESGVSAYAAFGYGYDKDWILNGGYIYFLSTFFSDATAFEDGIYKIIIDTITKDNVIIRDETCYFMDCNISAQLIDTIEVDDCKEFDVRLTMLHYALVVASSRGCDCNEMQNIFNFLNRHLNSPNTDPCGC